MDDMAALFPQRRDALVAIAAVLLLLLLVGRLLVHAGAPSGTASQPIRPLARSAAPSVVVVDVVGAVRRPGLYRLHEGDRIADAVARAGGVTPRAVVEAINLAAPIVDGEQVAIPRRGAPTAAGDVGAAAAGPVHLSTATAEQLDALPGVGPVTAQKILDYRSQHGAFRSVEELDAIPGIGPARLEQLRGLVAP
jgi:competence protein ComEA